VNERKATRVAIYARVSTKDQHCSNQIDVLTEWCELQGHRVTKVYTDAGISGTKRRDKRPGLDAALKDAARAEYDLLAAFAVDRLGRSTVDLLQTLESLHDAGIDLFLHAQAIDTRTSTGKALFTMLSLFGELERAMLIERVNAGLARARSQGKKLGRPPLDADVTTRIRTMADAGRSQVQIARETGASRASVQRALKSSPSRAVERTPGHEDAMNATG
jgi:DNA invertase Pin-like site-specific DNA recombinase